MHKLENENENLAFDEYISKLCSKATKKLSTLFRISRGVSLERRIRVLKLLLSLSLNLFNYFPCFTVDAPMTK